MANDYYTKNIWTARQGTGLDKFTLTESGGKTVIAPSPDSVTQQGTPLSAATFNDLESRIDTGFSNVATAVAGKTAVKLNGSNTALSDISIYAPSDGGASGQVLQSNGQLAPSWTKKTAVKLNGSNTVSNDASLYAPTASGTSGEVLKSNGANAAPTWTTKTAVKLNGSSNASSDISIYAPTSAGASGQVLVSSGSGAPSWGAPSSSIAWGNITGTLSSQTDLQNALDAKSGVKLNGSSTVSASPAFYAPVSYGSYGQWLSGIGNNTPQWNQLIYSNSKSSAANIPGPSSSSTTATSHYFYLSEKQSANTRCQFIVQYGSIYNSGNTSQSVTLPVSFSNTDYVVILQDATNGHSTEQYWNGTSITFKSNSSFTYNLHMSGGTIFWVAIGKNYA